MIEPFEEALRKLIDRYFVIYDTDPDEIVSALELHRAAMKEQKPYDFAATNDDE